MVKNLKKLLKLSMYGLSLLIFSVFILKAPEIHKDIIRSYVGGNTVVLKGDRSGGTGFHVQNEDGDVFLLTNKHVCEIGFKEDGKHFLYAITQNGRFLPRKVLAISKSHDLCVLEAVPGFEGLEIASSLDVGANIAIVGHPKLYPLQISRGEFIGSRVITLLAECQSKRIISPFIISEKMAFYVNSGYGSYCTKKVFSNHITAYSRGGSSGSPVVNFFGNVVGVLFAGNRADQFDSYMVPLYEVQSFINNEI